MVPTASAGDTTSWRNPDSWDAWASARAGSTPMSRAVASTICRICAGGGTARERSCSWCALAESTTSRGYWRPAKESPTAGSSSGAAVPERSGAGDDAAAPALCSGAASGAAPGTTRVRPGRSTSFGESELARRRSPTLTS